ncbi:MAG: radical SAM family heme chaperone HemW [Gammaproteobacteria bacterium]|nr:radical SAM family heme chaperone HemW [Gammaproteobacteria bacterium]
MAFSLPPLSLYLHLPWCIQKCPYCDFNSHRAGKSAHWDRYVAALSADIEAEAAHAGDRPIESVFIGGGTPSLFSPDKIATIIDACRRHLSLADLCEITMEANPGTVEHGSLVEYRRAGISRLSIGAQSFNPNMLTVLGRIHGRDEIEATYAEACEAGFGSINIDLMFALPGQDLADAMADIQSLLAISPPHVSWYQLTLEPNTVFHRNPPAGIPDDDLTWEIQQSGNRLLTLAGYEQYEISAFAKPGHRCRHNLNYWQFGDYLAAGAGAHGKLTDASGVIRRYHKPANPLSYMEQAESGAFDANVSEVRAADAGFEFMLNVLRLSDGVPVSLLTERTGLPIDALNASVDAAVNDGLLKNPDAGHFCPTADGFRLLNELQSRFLPG